MPEIKVIKRIRMTHSGPVNEAGQLIHLQQGSLDGACGPYSLLMSLIICGAVSEHEKLVCLKPVRKNGATGKALLKMNELTSKEAGSLFRNGTDLCHLQDIAKSYRVNTEVEEARPIRASSNEYKTTGKSLDTKNVKDFVIKKVSDDHPVILWLDCGDSAHWLVVVGLEYASQKHKEMNKVSRFLLLDPDAPGPRVAAWNGAIEISSRREWHMWGSDHGEMPVTFRRALAVIT